MVVLEKSNWDVEVNRREGRNEEQGGEREAMDEMSVSNENGQTGEGKTAFVILIVREEPQ